MSFTADNAFDMIINASEFSPKTNIKFADCKVNPKTSAKSVGIINNKNNSSVKLNFPLALTWGAQEYTDPTSGKVSYSMSIQFPGEGYTTVQTDKWLANMIDMEEVVLNYVMANWKKLFNKPTPSREVAEALYSRSLKYSKDKETGEINLAKSPTIKIKLGYWDGKFDFEIYSPDGKLIYSQETHPHTSPLELIPKASQSAIIVQCGGIWFAGGKFGVTWKLIQAVVKPKPTMKGRCLIALTPEDKTTINTQQLGPDDEDDGGDSAVTSVQVAEDSDEEPEPPAPAPAPAPVQKKPEPVQKKPEPVPEPVVVAPAPAPAVKKVVKRKVAPKTGDE
jgi:hypothetical protein